MVAMTGIYEGEKRCLMTHGPSQVKLSTDAPKDNNGRGEAFSPTDLVGAALGSCILTTMAIRSEVNGIDLKGAHFQVIKKMQISPRQIAELEIEISLPSHLTVDQRAWLEEIAHTCPVARSLHPDIKLPVKFNYISL